MNMETLKRTFLTRTYLKRICLKRTLAICVIAACASPLSGAQGFAGKFKLSGHVTAVTGHCVALTWNTATSANSYNVYRGTSHGGPYARVATAVVAPAYTDVQVTQYQTLYYVTTAVSGSNESPYSNETVADIP